MKDQHIGNIARHLGVSSRSIRYYEELGLISPVRSNGGFRKYSEPEIKKLCTILKLKKLGLTLEEISDLVNLKQCKGNKRPVKELLTYLHSRLHEFEEKIRDYKDGIKEINSLIDVIKSCSDCKGGAEIFKCEECLKEQDKEMPELMKAMF